MEQTFYNRLPLLGVKNLSIAAFTRQTNEKVERYSPTIVATFRNFVPEEQKDLDTDVSPLMWRLKHQDPLYYINLTIQQNLGESCHSTRDLAVCLNWFRYSKETGNRQILLHRVKCINAAAKIRVTATQEIYKNDYDKRALWESEIRVGDEGCIHFCEACRIWAQIPTKCLLKRSKMRISHVRVESTGGSDAHGRHYQRQRTNQSRDWQGDPIL